MIRILIFILGAVFFVFMATWLANMDSRFSAELFGANISMPSGLALGVLLFSAVALVLATHYIEKLAALPGKIRARDREARRERGITALTRGLEAVAVGDPADAQHHARVARRNLDETSLTRLLTAQAAQLAGDDAAAAENFSAMLESPETEFLGLKGLYVKAMREGDKAAARGYAERAFKLRANAKWAFESVFDLGLERGAWGETRSALAIAEKNNIVEPEKARRANAALLTADAYAADLSGDKGQALKEADAVLKLAPGFAPAAVLAARLHDGDGRTGKGAKILEQAFSEAPNAALIQAHINLYANEETQKRAQKLKQIIDRAPTAREAKIALARLHIMKGEFPEAISTLEPLLVEAATARECAIMAEAVAGAYDERAARPWLERAASAPRDPRPGADGDFHFTREGWARLVREYMDYERLAPPPLEEAPLGIPSEQMKLLLAPPPPPESEPSPDARASDEASPDDAAAQDETEKGDDADDDNERAVSAAREVS